MANLAVIFSLHRRIKLQQSVHLNIVQAAIGLLTLGDDSDTDREKELLQLAETSVKNKSNKGIFPANFAGK